MIVGSKDRFAIQWELDRNCGGQYLFGKICFWVSNNMIGDYELGTSLSDVFAKLHYPVADSGKRHSQRFCHMGSSEAFSLIHDGLFESDPDTSQVSEAESWARFDVSINVDVFDGYKFYLFDCINWSRLLIGHRPDEQDRYKFMKEQRLALGEFDAVIRVLQEELGKAFSANDPLRFRGD